MGIDFDPTMTPDGKLAAFESKTLEYRRDLSSRGRIIKTRWSRSSMYGAHIDRLIIVLEGDGYLDYQR